MYLSWYLIFIYTAQNEQLSDELFIKLGAEEDHSKERDIESESFSIL
jgi:hypothetical protein